MKSKAAFDKYVGEPVADAITTELTKAIGLELEAEGEFEAEIDLDQRPKTNNSKLQNLITYLYKGQGNPNKIGNGTTMAAIRYELSTWHLVEDRSHI